MNSRNRDGCATIADNATERTVTDLSATGPAKSYRINIKYP